MRRLVLWLAIVVVIASLGTLARLLIFFVQFEASWPAMFCYGPQGAFMFEGIAGIPLLGACLGCVLAIGHGRIQTPAVALASGVACAISIFLLLRAWQLVSSLTGHQYDEGCGRVAAWAWQYPLLNLVTQPKSAVAVFALAVVAAGVVIRGATQSRVA